MFPRYKAQCTLVKTAPGRRMYHGNPVVGEAWVSSNLVLLMFVLRPGKGVRRLPPLCSRFCQ